MQRLADRGEYQVALLPEWAGGQTLLGLADPLGMEGGDGCVTQWNRGARLRRDIGRSLGGPSLRSSTVRTVMVRSRSRSTSAHSIPRIAPWRRPVWMAMA
jgi:hypothetical protein